MKLEALFSGGGQERGLRSGTLAPGISLDYLLFYDEGFGYLNTTDSSLMSS